MAKIKQLSFLTLALWNKGKYENKTKEGLECYQLVYTGIHHEGIHGSQSLYLMVHARLTKHLNASIRTTTVAWLAPQPSVDDCLLLDSSHTSDNLKSHHIEAWSLNIIMEPHHFIKYSIKASSKNTIISKHL